MKSQPLIRSTNARAESLIAAHGLTEGEIVQLIAAARIVLGTFDESYRANVCKLAWRTGLSRPTIYARADLFVAAAIEAIRGIKTGRPPR